MARVGRNMLGLHPDVARRVLKDIDERCSMYYIIIGSVYNLAQSAMVDAMPLLKESKWWRFEVKKDANAALGAYESWNSKMKMKLWDKYQMWLDVSDAVADKMKVDVQKLRWSYDALLMREKIEEHTLKSYLLTASTLNDIAENTFGKFLRDGSKNIGVDLTEMFKAESSFAAVKANWDKAVAPIMMCGGGNIDCNKDSNCVLAGDIICRKLADIEMYEEACKYAADLNMDIVEKYMEA